MSYPLDRISNAPVHITLAGQTFLVRQLRLRQWGELQAWLREAAPDPIRSAVKAVASVESEGKRVADHIQRHLFAVATEECRRWPPKVGTAAWLAALDAADPLGRNFIAKVLDANGIVFSDEGLDEICDGLVEGELATLMAMVLWGHVPAPKSDAPAAAPTQPRPTTGESLSNESLLIVRDGPLTMS